MDGQRPAEFLKEGWEPRAVRVWLLEAGFRKSLHWWTWTHPDMTHVLAVNSCATFEDLARQAGQLAFRDRLREPLGSSAGKLSMLALEARKAWHGRTSKQETKR